VSFSRDVSRARAIAWKDLLAERRVKANFTALVFLGMLMLMLFGFALGPDGALLREAFAGLLWLTVMFAGVLAFNRSYQLELEHGAIDTLLAYPGARWSIFAGKLAANLLFVLLMLAVIVPLASILYQIPLGSAVVRLAPVLVLGTLGFVTLGTFYAAVASQLRAREVLLPLLLFPMMVPVLVAAVGATQAALTGDPLGEGRAWLRLLIAFDAIFLVASVLVFEHLFEG
jgi:heme exporter protein B